MWKKSLINLKRIYEYFLKYFSFSLLTVNFSGHKPFILKKSLKVAYPQFYSDLQFYQNRIWGSLKKLHGQI